MRHFAMLCGLPAVALTLAAGCGGQAAPANSAKDAASGEIAVGDSQANDGQGSATGDATGDATSKPDWPPTDCDDLIPTRCALPWPSNLYLQPDAKRKTGFALRFGGSTLPPNKEGKHIAPDDYRMLDGYSLGTQLLLHWPSLDTANLPTEASLDKSLADDAALVLLQVDAQGAVVRKVPYWAEVDATEPDAAKRTLIVRPARILEPGTRYVVGVRGLKDMSGKAIAPSAGFTALATGKTAGTADAVRQARFDDLLGILDKAGWKKDSLIVAWDFVTNSDESLHGRLYKVREDAYKAVGDKGPELTITEVKAHTVAEDAHIGWTVSGTFKAPNFLYDKTSLFQRLQLDGAGQPVQVGWVERPFGARIPRSAATGKAMGLVQYGHGLNGHFDEIEGGYQGEVADKYGHIVFGCLMKGMSQFDVGGILYFLADMSDFATMPDKLVTGIVESVLLQRAMREQFADLPKIKELGIKVDKTRLYYTGNSQGGIFGASVMAVSKDIVRGHLGVPGNNYSTLLQRSSDFKDFFEIIKIQYPVSGDQLILLATIQLLWDQADPVSWYRHIVQEPLAGNTPHQVLLVPAKGDWQVAAVTNEILARSGLGVSIMKNYGKSVFGVSEQAYPFSGSGIVMVDVGNPWPKPGNMPPHDDLGDPHGKPRKMAWIQEQMMHFLDTGEIKDVCGGDGCTPD